MLGVGLVEPNVRLRDVRLVQSVERYAQTPWLAPNNVAMLAEMTSAISNVISCGTETALETSKPRQSKKYFGSYIRARRPSKRNGRSSLRLCRGIVRRSIIV